MVGANCTTNGDECTNVGNTECGDDLKCTCSPGYQGNVGDASCTEGQSRLRRIFSSPVPLG